MSLYLYGEKDMWSHILTNSPAFGRKMKHIPPPARAIIITMAMIVFALAACGGLSPKVDELRRFGKDKAVYACRDVIREKAEFPAKVKFHLWRVGGAPVEGITEYWLIEGNAELMNSMGKMISYEYECVYDDGLAVVTSFVPKKGPYCSRRDSSRCD